MLFADLREKIDALEVERDLRERFVSILAHDLRGPLATAKMSAERLISRPEKLDERRELAIKIDRNIERTDSMICDLLDVSRMHAGQRLTIRLEECDLGAIARDVVDEMSALHGNRFTLQTDHRARGIWSASELRRALWNLVSNAVKYGASERPISISIRRRDGWVEAAVHNDGAPISPQDQARLFHPFSRARAVQVAGPRGWGLGLALVHGCAEHHGGRVRLQSDAATGTTFTLELPLDARPYQSHAEGAAAAP
jgi:signal transduction histidine kinase